MIQIFLKHKFIALLVLAALGGGGYASYNRWWKEPEPTRYILARVDRGTLITSVSGSGQVSSSNQVDVKPKASGDLVFLGVANGQAVRAGAIIARIDARDAAKTVRDAEVNLASAKLALEKLKKPADTLTLLQAEHALVQAHEARLKAAEDLRSAEIALEKLKKPADALAILQAENALVTARDTKRKAEEDLTKAYDDGFNTVATAFLDLPSIVAGIRDLLNDTTFERYQSNESWYLNQVIGDTARSKAQQYRTDAIQGYTSAQLLYATNFDTYKATSRLSETTRIEALIGETYVTTKSVADAVKSINNYIDFVKNDMDGRDAAVPAGVTT
ncbi:biotin/lipoyl-binding protein, partial [Candidatus Uhrbacteria bacterium]|nr:biotin/lipoyl-binding protein [Candidatus Uhrbacteria bacterium]